MKTSGSQKSVLIIAGMHRSGTSLTASLLQSAGVDIGKRLLGADQTNAKGHFEDLDFFDFHESVLFSQGISKAGWTLNQNIQVQEQYKAEAKLLIHKRASLETWGWKDPRTVLFLNFWQKLIPDASFVFVYRSPWEVIDSLYRRGDEIFNMNPNFALQVWMNYNRAIIDFYDNFSDKCVLSNIQNIIQAPNSLIELVKDKLGISLSPVANVYDESLFHYQISHSHRPVLIKDFFPTGFSLYDELNLRSDLTDASSLFPNDGVEAIPSYQTWVLQDWLDVRQAERNRKQSQAQLQQTQTELAQSQAQLQQTQTELAQSQAQLQLVHADEVESYAHGEADKPPSYKRWLLQDWLDVRKVEKNFKQSQTQLQQTQTELTQSQAQLQQTQTELAQSQAQLQQTQTELTQSQAQLQQTQTELAQSQAQLQQTQTELAQSQAQLQQTQTELAQSQAQLQQTQTELAQSQAQLQQTQTELTQSQAQLQQTQTQLRQTQFGLEQAQNGWENSQSKLQQAQEAWEQAQGIIRAMESSKFWKLRKIWFRFK
ncbi:MAG: chromosome partitioning protein ParA [Cyanothece sp. SIO1E1]|nr:chromosome partitioning protein ParA [Cyanothece sp. SIO1E1]